MLRVAIRADGNSSIGMGHIMRCLSLANAFRQAGCKVYFISKFNDGIEKIKSVGFEVLELKYVNPENINDVYFGNESELEFEAKSIIEYCKSYIIDLLIVDSYSVTNDFFLTIRPYIKKLAYIDDINKFVYPVDILINGNITGEFFNYQKFSNFELLLLGSKYNMIRDEFKNLPKRFINKQVNEIMLTTGGSDPYDLSMKMAEHILEDSELREVKLNIIVGDAFKNREHLRRLSKQNNSIILHENAKKISEIMLKSDMAVSAGGSTLYELSACGTPTLAFVMVDNQELIVQKMYELGYIETLGWHRSFTSKEFVQKVKELFNSFEKRNAYSEKMQKLVDGEGARRVVKEILKNF